MIFTLATWNINSVRLRMNLIRNFLEQYKPNILCLQETKCPDNLFPFDAFSSAGYPYMAIHGQKGYHGVATISRTPLQTAEKRLFTKTTEARHLSVIATMEERKLLIHNVYVPAGGDEPNPSINPKFKQKLDFINEMRKLPVVQEDETSSILAGDLNVAPLVHDVWSHKQLLNVVSHTCVETTSLENMRKECGWIDLMRCNTPHEKKLYTWWSYRAKDWQKSNRGRRLDHIWSSANMQTRLHEIEIIKEARGWERPSDHAPVIARLKTNH